MVKVVPKVGRVEIRKRGRGGLERARNSKQRGVSSYTSQFVEEASGRSRWRENQNGNERVMHRAKKDETRETTAQHTNFEYPNVMPKKRN